MILSCNNISKSFGTDIIIKSCSFNIEDHEKAAIVGINGAGKSTLLKIIARIEASDKGEVSIRKGLKIGYVSQDDSFGQTTTIKDALEKNRLTSHLNDLEWQTNIFKISALLELPPPTTLITALSGGQRKRLAIAAELIDSPDLLLLDEPTNHLDYDTKESLEKTISKYP